MKYWLKRFENDTNFLFIEKSLVGWSKFLLKKLRFFNFLIYKYLK